MISPVCNEAAGFVVCGIAGHTLVLLTANSAERPLRAGRGWTVWEGASSCVGLSPPNEQLPGLSSLGPGPWDGGPGLGQGNTSWGPHDLSWGSTQSPGRCLCGRWECVCPKSPQALGQSTVGASGGQLNQSQWCPGGRMSSSHHG